VSAILFVPVRYFQSLRHTSDFGRIYHPLMLQILQPRQTNTAAAASASSSGAPLAGASGKVFDLRLIGYPHKREGRLLKEIASEVLDAENAQALQRFDESGEHFSDIDETAFVPASPVLRQLRSKLQSLAHELPLQLPLPSLHVRARLPQLLPSLDQLASLRFPALSLPGNWVSATGDGGISTQDDIRTQVHHLLRDEAQTNGTASSPPPPLDPAIPAAAASSPGVPTCPPPFILWGMTLERTCDLMLFLGHPFMFDYFQRGSDKRYHQQKHRWWVAEANGVRCPPFGLRVSWPFPLCFPVFVQSPFVWLVVEFG
jgi:hypothetical protein